MEKYNYSKLLLWKLLNSINKKVKFNSQLQQLYNTNYSLDDDGSEFMQMLMEYNLSQPVPFLACGMSGYFNNQIDNNGLSNTTLTEQDKEDAKFIAKCFGKDINYSDNQLPILYTTLLGTTEMNYGMQTFPAGIYEDVFQCSADHTFPIEPIVGEEETHFWLRVLENAILNCSTFPIEKREEVLFRGQRLAEHFCKNKNRIYLIPIDNVLENKASFGDASGLRDGSLSGDNLKSALDKMDTFRSLLSSFAVSMGNLYGDPNMTSEYGIAIYGQIPVKGVSFFEVDRKYDLLQKKAKEQGYIDGEIIPMDFEFNTIKNQIK